MDMARKRLARELSMIRRDPPDNCSASPEDEDDLFKWKASIFGPPGSPYEGGVFNLSMVFPSNYPNTAPKVQFLTKVYHPNISSSGNICVTTLSGGWSPALTVPKVLLSISSLLTEPNADDPLVSDAAKLYKSDKNKYNETAADWTRRYASP